MNRYRYVRDEDHKPLAVIACIGPGMVGAAVCSKNDQFNKKLGKHIAEQRAKMGKPVVFNENRKFINYMGEERHLLDVVNLMVEQMTERSLQHAPAPTPFNPNPSKDI